MSVEEKAEEAIPAVVRMFSGCEDKQTSADGKFAVDAVVVVNPGLTVRSELVVVVLANVLVSMF